MPRVKPGHDSCKLVATLRRREMSLIKGKTGEWEMVIGLEVHAQVISDSKLFSGASTQFGAEPNSQVSLVDAAMPGMLPGLNKYVVEQAVRTGLGIKAKINLTLVFECKNIQIGILSFRENGCNTV